MRYAGLAAIALTVIIAVPILLGYGLASDEVEYTKTSESDVTSITDALLNNTSDYYIDYSKTNNNSGMLQRVTTQGDSYYIYQSPDYVSVGSNYTSIPAYETTSHTSTPSGTVLHTLTESIATSTPENPAATIGYGLGENPSDYWSKCGEIDVVYGYHNNYTQYVNITSSSTPIQVFIDGVTNTNYYPYEDEANGIVADSITSAWDSETDTYTFTVGNAHYTGKWAYICCYRNGTGLWNEYDFDTINPTDNGTSVDDWTFTMDDTSVVKLTYFDDSVEYKIGTTVSHTANYTIVDDDVVGQTKSVGISHLNSCVLEYYTRTSSSYADPSYGWYNAESSYSTYYNAWYNTYQNARLTFYAHFEGNGQTYFYDGFEATNYIVSIQRLGGNVYVIASDTTVYDLGNYEYVQILFDTLEDEVTVNGISAMPSFGASANTLNSITMDYDYNDYIELLKIVDQFSTITESADYYTTTGNTVTIGFDYIHPIHSFLLTNEDGDNVTSGWTAALSTEDYQTATFTATSLTTGRYTLTIYGPQIGSESVTIYVNPTSYSTSPIAYRVDNAYIVAGDYPSTVDYTLDIWSLFPNDTVQRIYINSIGVYGDSISIASRNYTVTNGTITITDIETGKTFNVKLLKSMIMLESDGDGQYTAYINGRPIAETSTQPTVYFGGEWSLTATRTTLDEETALKSSWTPGEFALDENGFVLAMVLTAVAVFVVLGMTGARSGAKVGLLALICGGACAVGLIIL